MRKFLAIVFLYVPAFLVLAFAVFWGTLAVWFKLPVPDVARWCASGLFAVIGLRALFFFFAPGACLVSEFWGGFRRCLGFLDFH